MSQFVLLILALSLTVSFGGLEVLDSIEEKNFKNIKIIALKYLVAGGVLL